MFDALFLVACILVLIVIIFYLFFWNRFLGYFISFLIRFSLWNRGSSSSWIGVGSIQFSLLGGRILFKDLRYHSSNQTVRIVKGQISWRYWIRRPTKEHELSGARVGAEDTELKKRWPLACRVHLSAQGLEWFLYNRTAAFDNVVAQMQDSTSPSCADNEARLNVNLHKEDSPMNEALLYPPTSSSSLLNTTPSTIRKIISWIKSQLPILSLTDLLPVSLEVEKGAILCGNASTLDLLVAEFKKAEGTFGVVQSRSKFDFHKQMLSLKFRDAVIHYAINPDYVAPMSATGKKIHKRAGRSHASHQPYIYYEAFLKLWRRVNLAAFMVVPSSKVAKTKPTPAAHLGSFRNRNKGKQSTDDDTPVGADFTTLEYAIERKLLEAPVLELSYYADVVGIVPPESYHHPMSRDPFDIGNGDLPPEWGFDIVVRNGFLRYGPWADRQRAELQRAFFPSPYRHVRPTARLKPGDHRVWPSLKIFIELRDSTTLQIPFREASKDWQWDGLVNYPRPRKREVASLHLRAGENSTISYVTPMTAGPEGYEPIVEVHLDTVTVTSNFNDIRLLSAESCRIHGELPSPLRWDAERQWTFSVSLRRPIMYLIREHINMFTDLGKDWSSGSPSDYHRFVPMVYVVKFDMQMYELNTYANDHNIIDKPAIREENALLTMRGTSIKCHVQIDSSRFRPTWNTVPFSVVAPDLLVRLTLPRWNSHSVQVGEERADIGRIGEFRLDGFYRYYSETKEHHIDQLKLDISGCNIVLKCFGWVVRHFMVVRDNYFGSFTQFSTLYEYLEKQKRGLPIGDLIELKYRPKKSNLLHVVIQVDVDHGLVVLPAGLPGFEKSPILQDGTRAEGGIGGCVALSIPKLQVHMRTHDYFMEMSMNSDPISGSIEGDFLNKDLFVNPPYRRPRERILIDGLHIVANRLFGPQPHTSTYMCIWEIHVGRVKSVLSISESRIVLAAVNAFRVNFADVLNAPAKEYSPQLNPDVTVLKVSVDTVDTTWQLGNTALQFTATKGLRFESNNVAGRLYRKVTSVRLRHGCVKLLLASRPSQSVWLEAAHVDWDVSLDLYDAPSGWREVARSQAEFIAAEDAPTGRANALIAAHGLAKRSTVYHKPRLGVHELYLTDLQLPAASHMHTDSATSEDQQIPQRHLPYQSDSDEDDVSETMRDERLARSRPVTPLLLRSTHDDGSMSSGDESDDEDLTDPEQTDSDWSESRETPSATVLAALLSRYRKYTRLYLANTQEAPSSWDGQAFRLFKDHRPLGNFNDREPLLSNYVPSLPLFSEDNLLVDSTTVRVLVDRGINFFVTPLLTPAVSQIVQDVILNQPSPELYFDALLKEHINSFPGSSQSHPTAMVIDLSIVSVAVQFLHEISPGKMENFTMPEPPLHVKMPLDGRVNIATVGLTGLRVVARSAPAPLGFPAFNMSLDSISIAIHSADRHYAHRPSIAFKDVFSFDISLCKASLIRKKFILHLDKVCTTIDHSSPANVIASVGAVGSMAKKVFAIHQRWSRYSLVRNQQMIRQVLVLANGKSIIDPLSTIQPSYLIHKGRPHQLRTDSTYKLLLLLRHSLRYQDQAERQIIIDFIPDLDVTISLESILPLLINGSMASVVDPDVQMEETLSTMPILQTLFPSPKEPGLSSPLPNSDDIAKLMTITIGSFGVELWDVNKYSHNEFTLRSLSISVGQHVSGLLQATPGAVGRISIQKSRRATRHLAVNVSVDEVGLIIFPHLMDFAQQVLRVRLSYTSRTTSAPSIHAASPELQQLTQILSTDVVLTLKRLKFKAAAEKLVIEFGTSDIALTSSLMFAPSSSSSNRARENSMNHSLFFSEIMLRACAAGAPQENNQHVLASLAFTDGKISTVMRQEPSAGMITRVLFSLGCLDISVPRSAIRLYRFVEEWRADYLPGIQATVRTLISEIREVPQAQTIKHSSKPPNIYFNLSLRCLRVSLLIMHGTWLSWEVERSAVFYKTSATMRTKTIYSFGLQMGSQTFSISSQPHWFENVQKSISVKFGLPMISVTGKYDGTEVHMICLVEFFSLTSRPSHWDTLLTVQQKFGQDFNDLISLINEKRVVVSSSRKATGSSKLKYSGFMKMRGFQIGLEGASSTLLLECEDVGGGINDGLDRLWNIGVSDLAFSLAPRTLNDAGNISFDRLNRLAFVVIDFQINAGLPSASSDLILDISVTKIHAVMQPSSMGELGDFIDHLQAELAIRAEQRAIELAEFKQKTMNVMRTFETRDKPPSSDAVQDWVSRYTLKFILKNIGFAFPLALDQELKPGSQDSSAVKAFLFSIKSLMFNIHRGESGQAVMKSSSFQFVSRFRQSASADFIGENHQTRNRLLYPEMNAHLKSERSDASRRIRIGADVDGFFLDIDSSIPNYVFSLIDVYRQGKERMVRLTSNMPRNSHSPNVDTTPRMQTVSVESQYNKILASNILGSLIFQSGKVRLYSSSAATKSRTRTVSLSTREVADEHFTDTDIDVDVFNLPVFSVLAEYRGTPAHHKLGEAHDGSSTLMFKCTVHSSANGFRPTILSFITEIVNHVEQQMRKATLQNQKSRAQSHSIVPTVAESTSAASDSVSRMRISFSLRIDQSKLELTCHPDANVIAGVHWDSGGFVVNISPGAKQVAFTGSVGGLTVGLKHGFLSEDCVRLDARNLAFTVTFSQMHDEMSNVVRSLSIILDTEFSGSVRFSRFQDILCFKAVWVDRILMFRGQGDSFSKELQNTEVLTPPTPVKRIEHGLVTIIMLRLRYVKLEIDLGQSITSLTAEFKDAVLRTKLFDEVSEFSFSVEQSSVLAMGNMSGRGNVPDFLFQTRCRQRGQGFIEVVNNMMLDLTMTSGPLNVVLESDHQMILQYHAEPLQVMIFDDWTKISGEIPSGDRRLRLSFTVFGKEVTAITTVGTVPKLVAYGNKFKANLAAQREGASRESRAFRMASSPKPDDPLSEVAMFHSARSQPQKTETGIFYTIRQQMSLRLEALRLVVFPRTMFDSDMVHFIGSKVYANLDRFVESEGLPPNRDLHLSFAYMTVSRFSQIRHRIPALKDMRYDPEWLPSLLKNSQEAIIFGLPSMTIRMMTDEENDEWSKTILYNFTSRFSRQDGAKSMEDIYITLNVSLYSWLTILRKNFAKDMNQVQASAERANVLTGTGGIKKQTKSSGPIFEEPDSVIGSPAGSRPSTPPLSSSISLPSKPNSKEDWNILSSPSKAATIEGSPGSGWFPSGSKKSVGIVYVPRERHIERLTMRQLGEATPDVMHPFFTKKAGFSLEDSLPQYVHEYATMPIEEIMKVLLNLYGRQLKARTGK